MIGSEIIGFSSSSEFSLKYILGKRVSPLLYLGEKSGVVLKPIISELRLFRYLNFKLSYMSKRDKRMGILANAVSYWLSLLQRTCLYVI